MKRWIALMLTVLLTTGLLAGLPASAENGDEVPTLDVVMFQWWDSASDIFSNYANDSEILAAFEKEVGVKLNFIEADAEQQQVYFVSGDLGDLCMINTVQDVKTLMDSELLRPLNQLVEEYGPNVKSTGPDRWQASIEATGDGAEAYALPIQAGNEGTAIQNGRYIYTLRYDHWAELGFPEWTNYYEYLDDVAKLLKAHPTTDEGLSTIGISVQNESTTTTSSFENCMYGTVGFGEAGSTGSIMINIADGTLVNNYVDEFSPYWLAVDFYRYANKLGILDPDWAVQSATELYEKYNAGRIIATDSYVSGRHEYIDVKLAKDPNYLGGWINVPVKGTMIYQNAQQLGGWDLCFWGIPTSSEYPVEAMKLLNYTYGYDGARLVTNGIEGEHWEYDAQGVPVLTQKFLDLPLDKGDRRILDMLGMLRGLSNATLCPDGSPVNLTYSDAYFASTVKEPWLLAYDEHYGISWPNEKFLELTKDGYIFDRSRYDQRIMMLMAPYDDNMMRIDALCVSTAISYMARLVQAETDEEFAQLRAQMLAELEGYGTNDLFEYAKAKYDAVYEKLNLAEYLASFPEVQR